MVDMTLKQKDQQALEDARDEVYEALNLKQLAEQHRIKAIRQAAKNGASLREIAEIVGLSHQAVHKIVGRMGPAVGHIDHTTIYDHRTPPTERKRGPA